MPPDYWIPSGLMKLSELFDVTVENINNLDLETNKLESYSGTYYLCDLIAYYSLRNYYS